MGGVSGSTMDDNLPPPAFLEALALLPPLPPATDGEELDLDRFSALWRRLLPLAGARSLPAALILGRGLMPVLLSDWTRAGDVCARLRELRKQDGSGASKGCEGRQ